MKVKVGVSNRHVHLSKEVYNKLFNNEPLNVKRKLNQIGEFVSDKKVTLMNNGKIIDNVTVVGPLRDYTQVELLDEDFDYLSLEKIVRMSSDLENTPGISIISNGNVCKIDKGVIKACNHIHVNSKDVCKLGLKNNEKVIINLGKQSFEATIRVSDNGYYEMHIDKDIARLYNLNTGDEVCYEKL